MTLLIKNAQLVDGTGSVPVRKDVFISGDTISAIGNFPEKGADRVLDGNGGLLAPGFIDAHNNSDHYLTLFEHPTQSSYLKQGVTTIIGGTCGASLAPLMRGTLQSLHKWTDVNRVNVDWQSVRELMRHFERHPVGVNFATYAGHGTIRRAIVGEKNGLLLRQLADRNNHGRALTKRELQTFAALLEQSMQEGALGLSLGLEYAHARGTTFAELKALASVVQKHAGLVAIHLQNGADGILEGVQEALKLRKETGARIILHHFLPLRGSEQHYRAAMEMIEQAGDGVYFDIHPFETKIVELYTFLPEWVRMGNLEHMAKELEDPWKRTRVMKELPNVETHKFMVIVAPRHDTMVGKTLADLGALYGMDDPKAALMELMRRTKLRAVVQYADADRTLLLDALRSPRALVGSTGADFGRSHAFETVQTEHSTATFTAFLSLAESELKLPLTEAVRRLTAFPAAVFGLKGRGQVHEGNRADLVCLRNGTVLWTVVNGEVAFESDAASQHTRAGRPLKPQAGKPNSP